MTQEEWIGRALQQGLEELAALQEKVERYEKALKVYADRDHWMPHDCVYQFTEETSEALWLGPGDNGGEIAREALAEAGSLEKNT